MLETFHFIIGNKYHLLVSLKGETCFIFENSFGQNSSLRNCNLSAVLSVTIALIALKSSRECFCRGHPFYSSMQHFLFLHPKYYKDTFRAKTSYVNNTYSFTSDILKWSHVTLTFSHESVAVDSSTMTTDSFRHCLDLCCSANISSHLANTKVNMVKKANNI